MDDEGVLAFCSDLTHTVLETKLLPEKEYGTLFLLGYLSVRLDAPASVLIANLPQFEQDATRMLEDTDRSGARLTREYYPKTHAFSEDLQREGAYPELIKGHYLGVGITLASRITPKHFRQSMLTELDELLTKRTVQEIAGSLKTNETLALFALEHRDVIEIYNAAYQNSGIDPVEVMGAFGFNAARTVWDSKKPRAA